VFIYGYQDKYKALPGDDSHADTHLGAVCVAPCQVGDGNGVLGGTTAGSTDVWNNNTVTNETQQFWIHVRLAGLAPGPTSGQTDYRPTNASGGYIGIQSNTPAFTTITSNAAGTAGTGMTGTYIICSEGILGKFVTQLDTTMDDGNTDTGAMRVTDAAGATGKSIANANIQDGQSYIVCMGV
jgi:hypothetical protein